MMAERVLGYWMSRQRLSQPSLGVWINMTKMAIRALILSDTIPPVIRLSFPSHQAMAPTNRATIGGMPTTKSMVLIGSPPSWFLTRAVRCLGIG